MQESRSSEMGSQSAKRVHFAEGVAPGCNAAPMVDQMAAAPPLDRRIFRDEAEAIECDRRRVNEILARQFTEIRPCLAELEMLHLSEEDLESILMQFTTELDALRQVDPMSGDLCETNEYIALEEKVLILLDALDYYSQKNLLRSLGNPEIPIKEKGACDVSERERVGKIKKQKYTCFSFIFKRSRCGEAEVYRHIRS